MNSLFEEGDPRYAMPPQPPCPECGGVGVMPQLNAECPACHGTGDGPAPIIATNDSDNRKTPSAASASAPSARAPLLMWGPGGDTVAPQRTPEARAEDDPPTLRSALVGLYNHAMDFPAVADRTEPGELESQTKALGAAYRALRAAPVAADAERAETLRWWSKRPPCSQHGEDRDAHCSLCEFIFVGDKLAALLRAAPARASEPEADSRFEKLLNEFSRRVGWAALGDEHGDVGEARAAVVEEVARLRAGARPGADLAGEALASALCDSSSHMNLMPHADQRPCEYHRKRAADTLAALNARARRAERQETGA